MVVFVQIFHRGQPGVRPMARIVFQLEHKHVNDYFPHHASVVAEYRLLPHFATDVFSGTMLHYPVGRDGNGPDVTASFLAWECVACGGLHQQFTEVEFRQPGGGPYSHCCCADHREETEESYDPNSSAPQIRGCLAPDGAGPDGGLVYFRSFVRDCHRCRRRYWNFIDSYRLNLRGEITAGPFCGDSPVNYAALAAARFHRTS